MAKDIKVALQLDSGQFNRAIKQSKAQVKDFETSGKRSLGLIRNAFLAIGGAAVFRSIVDIGSRFQDLNTSLSVVTGSADAGADAFRRINDLALTTQFGVEELTTGFIQLKGAGVDPVALGFDSLEDLLFSFSNSASVTTDQVGTLQALLDATSRTVAGGLNLEDLIRIQDRGIPVFTVFAKTLGIGKDQLTEIGRSAEGAAFLLKVLNESSDALFAGALENRLTNTSTLFSNLVISVKNTASALFVVMQPAIDAVLNKLTELSVGLFDVIVGTRSFSEVINELLPGLARVIKVLNDFSLVIFLLTAPTALRGLVALLGAMGNRFLSLTGVTVTTNLALTGFARFVGQAFSVVKQLLKPMNILIALTAGLALEFFKLNNTDFTFGEKLYIAIVEVVRDLVQLVAVVTVVGTQIGDSLAKGILAGFKGENPIVAIADDIAQNATIGSAFADSIADSLLGEDLRARLKENAEKNVADPIRDTEQTLEELIKAQQEKLEKLLKTSEQSEAEIKLDSIGEKYKKQYEELLKTIAGTSDTTSPLQQFNKFLDEMVPGVDDITEGFSKLNELLGDDDTVKGIRDYESGLNSLLDAFDVTPFDDFIAGLTELGLTTEEYNEKQRTLNALIQKYPELAEEAKKAQDALNDAYGSKATTMLNEFISSLNTAVDTLSTDLVDAFQNGQKAGDVFKTFFRSLINDAIAQILKLMVFLPILEALGFSTMGGTITGLSGEGLLGFLKPKATGAGGGQLMATRPTLVGEQGPELFIPSTSGSLLPNGGMGSQVTYNINAVDARSFQQLVASDPEFIFSVTEVGRRRIPGRL